MSNINIDCKNTISLQVKVNIKQIKSKSIIPIYTLTLNNDLNNNKVKNEISSNDDHIDLLFTITLNTFINIYIFNRLENSYKTLKIIECRTSQIKDYQIIDNGKSGINLLVFLQDKTLWSIPLNTILKQSSSNLAGNKRKLENNNEINNSNNNSKTNQLVINLNVNDSSLYYVETLDNLEYIIYENDPSNDIIFLLFNDKDDIYTINDQIDNITAKFQVLFNSKSVKTLIVNNEILVKYSKHFKPIVYITSNNSNSGILNSNDSHKLDNSIYIKSREIVVVKQQNEKLKSLNIQNNKLIVNKVNQHSLNGIISQSLIFGNILICLISGVLKFICINTLLDENKITYIESKFRFPPNNIIYFSVYSYHKDISKFNIVALTTNSKLLIFYLNVNNETVESVSSPTLTSAASTTTEPILTISKWPKFTDTLIKVKKEHETIMDKIKSTDRSIQSINQLISIFSKKPFTQTSNKQAFSAVITPLISPLVDIQTGSPSTIFRFTLCNHSNQPMSDGGWNLLIRYKVRDFPMESTRTISYPIHLASKSSISFELSLPMRSTTTITFRMTLSFTIPQLSKQSIACNFLVSENTFHLLDFLKIKPIGDQNSATTSNTSTPILSSSTVHPNTTHVGSILEILSKILNGGSGGIVNISRYQEYISSQSKSLLLPVNGYSFSKSEISNYAMLYNYVFGKDLNHLFGQSTLQLQQTAQSTTTESDSNSIKFKTLELTFNNFKTTISVNSHDFGKNYTIQFGSKSSSLLRENRHLLLQSLLLRETFHEKLTISEENYSKVLNYFKDKMKLYVPRKESIKQTLKSWQTSINELLDLESIESLDKIQLKLEQNSQNLQKIQDLFENIIII